jgi:hypothetical protein
LRQVQNAGHELTGNIAVQQTVPVSCRKLIPDQVVHRQADEPAEQKIVLELLHHNASYRAAICAKGRAAPELVYHQDRLRRPLRRTRPKGNSDPGWEEITWDAALDQSLPQCVAPPNSMDPKRLVSAKRRVPQAPSQIWHRSFGQTRFGVPNAFINLPLDLCGWGRGFATRYAPDRGSGTRRDHEFAP